MRIIAVVNQKGGCGKTTVSINLASALADMGNQTVLVDMDPQSHCAVGLAVPEEQIEQTIYDVLISKAKEEPIRLHEILWQITDSLHLAPSSIDLSALEQQTKDIAAREKTLKEILEDVKSDMDYVIIDCPPAVGLLTFIALEAATDIIVPVETGYFSLHGLSKQLETLNVLCNRRKRQINVKVLASMYDIRTKMAREILSELRSHFGDKMFKTTVNFNTKLKEAASFGQPITEYDSTSRGQKDFKLLAEEVVNFKPGSGSERHKLVNSLSQQLSSISSTADELLSAVKEPATVEEVARKPQNDRPSRLGNKGGEPVDKSSEELSAFERVEDAPGQKAEVPRYDSKQTDVKLSDYYGSNQIGDAVVFVTLYPRAESVHIAGDFNNWHPDKTPMQRVGSSGIWQTKLKLPAGKYRYRLVVDGKWQQDPYNANIEANPFGGFNSVCHVHHSG